MYHCEFSSVFEQRTIRDQWNVSVGRIKTSEAQETRIFQIIA